MEENKPNGSFLGTGWKFPPTFDKAKGSVEMVSDEQDIKESLMILLSTKKGERVMRPDFGCDMHSLLFEKVDDSLTTYIENLVEMAVLYYEPRITLEQVDVRPYDYEGGILHVNLEYTVRKTNTRSNMVFPFYLIEGTQLSI